MAARAVFSQAQGTGMSYLSLKNISSPRTVEMASKTRLLSHTCGVWGPVGWTGLGEGPKRKRDLGLVLPVLAQLLKGGSQRLF